MTSTPLAGMLRERLRTSGPISFYAFMEAALYDPEWGYYSGARNPLGREGDYYTASDLDPVFARVLARHFEHMAQALGVPAADFTVVELGAGGGLLARDILQHIPCRYRIVERSAAMRQRQRALLEGRGVEWVEDLPERLVGCVFSNEFFDALPVRRLVGRGGGLREIFVDENFNEVEREPAEPPNLPLAEGQLVDYAPDAAAWIGRIARSLDCGYHLAIDYGYLDREFYARPRGTLMCYRRHRLSEDPYAYVGEQDITAHVNFAELMRAGEAAGLVTHAFSTQMDYLVRMGVLDEIEALAPLGTAASISRIAAIKTLLLPGGMGERFKVLVQRTR